MGASIKGKGKGKGERVFNGGGPGVRSGPILPSANKRLVQKASRKTTLPTVEASPVKGGASRAFGGDAGDDRIVVDDSAPAAGEETSKGLNEDASRDMGDVFMESIAKCDGDEEQMAEDNSAEKSADKGKAKVKSKSKDASRRASMALSQLSQSLSAAPALGTSIKGPMGPPATPRKVARSVSSTYPGPSNATSQAQETETSATDMKGSTRSSASPDKVTGSGGKRFSARQAAKATLNAETKSPSTSAGPSGSTKKGGAEKKTEMLSVMKDCKIFIDVRTDDGEEAGSLFAELLANMGAKVRTPNRSKLRPLILNTGASFRCKHALDKHVRMSSSRMG
jgi:hypothetical protein